MLKNMPGWMVLNYWKGSIYSEELSITLWEWFIRFITKEQVLSGAARHFCLTSALRLSSSPALSCMHLFWIYYVQDKLTNSLSLEDFLCLLYFQKRLLCRDITVLFNCTATVSCFFFPSRAQFIYLKKKKPIKLKDLSA